MKDILKRLEKEILVFDGAIGTELQKRGLKAGDPPELWNSSKKDKVKEVHKAYVEAGSDIVQTNTFGANRLKLAEYGLENQIEKINKSAVKLVKEVSNNNMFISGSVGPTGKLLQPVGDFSFVDAKNIFAEQIKLLFEAGVDLITIETISDIQEARAAVIAAKEVSDIPVLCSLTFEKNAKTISGTDAKTAATILEAVGVDIIGVNCSLGPKGMIKVLNDLKDATYLPLSFKPNAGMPKLNELGETVYNADANYMASYVERAANSGANIVGGCCGTGPDYIKKVKNIVKKIEPIKREEKRISRLASRTKVVKIAPRLSTKVIGEKINPSGNKKLTEEMKNYNTGLISELALKQQKAGADIIDLNTGLPDFDQVKMIEKAIFAIHNKCDIPVAIDTTDYKAMKRGLEVYTGKALLNSVTGEERSLNNVLPLAKKYGAAIIALTLDEDGIPETASERLEIVKRILKRAKKLGIKEKDIIVDPLVLTVASSQEQINETLEGLKLIHKELALNTILGISNISYGLPARKIINRSFLAMAIKQGLNLAIVNPLDKSIMDTINASDLLLGKDKNAKLYIEKYNKTKYNNKKDDNEENSNKNIDSLNKNEGSNRNKYLKKSERTKLKKSIVDGDTSYQEEVIENLLKENNPYEIINQILIPAIKIVGKKYDREEYYLPQLMASAESMEKAVSILKPHIQTKNKEKKAKLLMATVKGDIHDIGKNIVKIMLENNGFKVYDLGKNVSDEKIIKAIEKNKIDIVALSSLMTTTMPVLKRLTEKIKLKFSDVQVIVGGAVVTEEYAKKIGADGYAANAFSAVEIAEKILKKTKVQK